MSIIPVTVPPKTLAQTISSTATSFKLNNITNWNGEDLTPADFGTEAFCVLTNSTRTQVEIFKFDPTTIADASITILARGLDYSGGLTPDLSRQYAWASNDTIVQLGTDAPQLFRDFMSESNTATVTALHTYDVLPQSAVVPANDEDFATKQYVDGLTEPAVTIPINQTSHNLAVGDVIRISGIDTYAKAQANSPANAEVVGIVTEVIDADNFKYITEGVTEAGVGIYPAGTVLFLSRTTAGALTDTDTTTIGEVSLPLAVVTQSSVRMIFHKYRPAVINTISGNPIASETVAGMVEQATPAQVTAKQDVGETGAPLFVVPSLIPEAPVPEQSIEVLAPVDGSVTPKAMGINSVGVAYPLDFDSRLFSGFIKEAIANDSIPDYLNSAAANFGAGVASFAFTANAGNDRYMLVFVWHADNTLTLPTGCTWNSLAFTELDRYESAQGSVQIWARAIGDAVSSEASTVSLTGGHTGGGGNARYAHAVVYDKTDQADPFNMLQILTPITGGTQSDIVHQATQGYGRMIGWARGVSGAMTGPTNFTLRAGVTHLQLGDVARAEQAQIQMTQCDGLVTMSLNSAEPTVSATLQIGGVVSGFTGLTAGSDYYLDDDGAVTDTPAGAGLIVGRAVSDTQIQMVGFPAEQDGAFLYQITGTGVPAYASQTAVQFQRYKYDTKGYYDSANPTRITIPKTGLYIVGATVQTVGNNYPVKAVMRKNGSTNIAQQGFTDGYGTYAGANVTHVEYFEAGDYIEILAGTETGSTSTSADVRTNFWIKSIK